MVSLLLWLQVPQNIGPGIQNIPVLVQFLHVLRPFRLHTRFDQFALGLTLELLLSDALVRLGLLQARYGLLCRHVGFRLCSACIYHLRGHVAELVLAQGLALGPRVVWQEALHSLDLLHVLLDVVLAIGWLCKEICLWFGYVQVRDSTYSVLERHHAVWLCSFWPRIA